MWLRQRSFMCLVLPVALLAGGSIEHRAFLFFLVNDVLAEAGHIIPSGS